MTSKPIKTIFAAPRREIDAATHKPIYVVDVFGLTSDIDTFLDSLTESQVASTVDAIGDRRPEATFSVGGLKELKRTLREHYSSRDELSFILIKTDNKVYFCRNVMKDDVLRRWS